jgi:hypothetical protein
MSVRRFRHAAAGRVTVGLEFDSEAELEAFLAGRGLAMPEQPAPSAARIPAPPAVKPGRPNMDAVIAAAVRAVAIGDASKATIARSVRAHIAAAAGGVVVPSARSITRRLGARKQSDKMLDKIMDKTPAV